MSWLFFSVATALLWGAAELFYKKGACPQEKYSHLKICVWVGLVMGLHAVFTLLTQDIDYRPVNLLVYLPVSLLYMISMAFSYFGMRFLEESISDPIENTSGALCSLLCVLVLGQTLSGFSIVAICIIVVGVLGVGFCENRGETLRKKTLGKKLALAAFCMPFVYALLDALGSFLDIFYLDDLSASPLVGVGEDTIEAVANTSYELTFALFALALFAWMKLKKVPFGPVFTRREQGKGSAFAPVHRDKLLAAVFETAGQFTYVYALSGKGIVAAPIISSVCVVSLLLSRIFLKEKLSWKTYSFIALVILGILLLSVAEEL